MPDKSGIADSSAAHKESSSVNKNEGHASFKDNKHEGQSTPCTKKLILSTAAKTIIDKIPTDTIINHPSVPSSKTVPQESSETKETSPLTPIEYSERYHNNIADNTSLNTPRINTHRKRFSLGIFASSMPDHSSATTSTTPFAASLGADNANWVDDTELGIMLFNKGKNTKRNVRHNLPFRAGITFAYRINNNISIESGVSYSLLSSDFTEGSDKNFIETHQTLHYIGIPINVRYNFLSWNKLDFYGSAGVIAEQCIAAKQNTDYIIDNRIEKSGTENIGEKPLQFSADIAAGIQFNATSLIGIYIEPGLAYHFKKRSELQTIYKDRPFDFNLNIGLRFTFGN